MVADQNAHEKDELSASNTQDGITTAPSQAVDESQQSIRRSVKATQRNSVDGDIFHESENCL